MSAGAAALLVLAALGCAGIMAWCAVQVAGIKATEPGNVAELRREVHAFAAELDDFADWAERRQNRDDMRQRRATGGAKIPSGDSPAARLARLIARRPEIMGRE